jgi:transposase InsO family protein
MISHLTQKICLLKLLAVFLTLGAFLRYYNHGRPHQALDYQFPAEVYSRDLRG